MARLAFGGFEGNHVHLEGGSLNNGATIGATSPHGGTYALQCASGAGNAAQSYTTPAFVVGTGPAHVRAYLRFANLPGSTTTVLRFQTTSVSARVTAGGKLQLWNDTGTPAQIGSDSAATLTTGTYYRIELRFTAAAAGSAAAELLLNGGVVATGTGLTVTATQPTTAQMGWVTAPGANLTCQADCWAVNDAAAGTGQTGYPGAGTVVLLKPISDNARDTNWLGGANGTTGLWDAVNNTPPSGVATASATDTSQIENAASTTTEAYSANLETYTTGGLAAGSLVSVAAMLTATGTSSLTSTNECAFQVTSNPAIGEVVVSVEAAAATSSTYPTGWGRDCVGITHAPSVTNGTSPVMRVRKNTAATRIHQVCFMGLLVDYVTSTVNTRTITPATVGIQRTNARVVPATIGIQRTNVRVVSATVGVALPPTVAVFSWAELEVPDAGTLLSRVVPATVGVQTTLTRVVPATVGIQQTNTRVVPATVGVQTTLARVVPATIGIQRTNVRPVPATVGVQQTNARTVTPATIGVQAVGTRTIPATVGVQAVETRVVPATIGIAVPAGALTRVVPVTVGIQTTNARAVPATVGVQQTNARAVAATIGVQQTNTRVVPSTIGVQQTNTRVVPSTIGVRQTNARTVPATIGITVPGAFARVVPATIGIQQTNARVVPSTVGVRQTNARVVPSTIGVATVGTRVVSASVGVAIPGTRIVPVSIGVRATSTRVVPATVGVQAASARVVPATVGIEAVASRVVPATIGIGLAFVRPVPASIGVQALAVRAVPATIGILVTGQVTRVVPATIGITLGVAFLAGRTPGAYDCARTPPTYDARSRP